MRASAPALVFLGVEFPAMAARNAPPKPTHTAILQGAVQPCFGEVQIRQRGRLPHCEKDSGLYFITFRLAGSYRLVAWCVMPNHVHVVCRLLPGQELAAVLQSWKSYTARKANGILERSGNFWQREYYHRLIRDEEEFARAVRYVVSNPDRAGLKDWKWVWSAGGDAIGTAGLETGATA